MSDAGEIIGRLKLDASDWMAKIEEAKGEAETLKAIDPKIQVTADTAGAIAGLSAVSASADKVAVAQERLRLATQASDRATASAMLAQMRLAAVQDKRGRTALQVASAEEALRVATERSDNAALRAIAAEDQLAAARRDAAKASLEEGAAADVAGNKTTDAAKGAVPWMGILVGSIAAVAPGMVAVGAAAIGISGELTGLGLAGVLAFKGIAAEMAAGTDLGNKYTDLFAGIQADLALLEHTAAAGIFTGLASGIHAIEGAVGPLNQDVALLSTQLGGLLATGATTAVHALAGFTPVLTASGAALQGFMTGIDGFTQSNGFTAFVDYTVARLPDVMHLIESTLGAVGGIFTALAPAGQSTLFMLSSLMDLIRALAPTVGALMPTVIGLSDAIGGIALVAATVLNALGPFGPMLVGTAAAMIGLSFAGKAVATSMAAAAEAEVTASVATRMLGAAVDFAAGPIGIALIAVGLLASALATTGGQAQDTATSIAGLTSALQQDNGVIGENTRATVAQNLASAGGIQAAQQLGLSLKTVTDASLGNAAAKKLVTDRTNQQLASNQALTSHMREGQLVLQSMNRETMKASTLVTSQNTALKSATDAYNKVAVASGQAKVSQQQMSAAAAAVHMPVAQFAAAAAAQQKTADTAEKTRNQYILLGDAANLLKLDMDKLNGASISNAEAQAAWASGLDSLKSSFNATSKAITGNSNAAIENRGAIASQVSIGETALQQTATMTHSVSAVTAQYKSFRAQLIQHVIDLGNSRAAATALVDQYFKIPKNIKTDFQGNDADAIAAAKRATAAGKAFASGDYKAAYKADPTPANKAKADAMAKAQQFAHAQYMAVLKANPTPANSNAADAARKAHSFASGYYMAYLQARTNAGSVAAQARAALNSVQSRDVYLTAHYSTTGVNFASGGVKFGATGGTATPNGMQGLAGGGSGMFSGTVSGAGNSWNDMAGYFRLANGEEVTSNMRGQADAFRGVLKAINSQKVKTPAQLGHMLGGGSQGPTTVINRSIEPHVTIVNPVAVDPVQQVIDANQYVLAYSGLG